MPASMTVLEERVHLAATPDAVAKAVMPPVNLRTRRLFEAAS